mgnify:CR=1 FL=1
MRGRDKEGREEEGREGAIESSSERSTLRTIAAYSSSIDTVIVPVIKSKSRAHSLSGSSSLKDCSVMATFALGSRSMITRPRKLCECVSEERERETKRS